jgi:uncharacterized MnhB-related membrane protein
MALLSAFFLCLMVICGIAALMVRDLLAAVIIFSAFSFFSALYFSMLGALDVAFTEAVVGAVISTVFFVSTIFRTARRPKT